MNHPDVPTLVFQEGSGNLMPHRITKFDPRYFHTMHTKQLVNDLSKMLTPEPLTVNCGEYVNSKYYFNNYCAPDTIMVLLQQRCAFANDANDAPNYWQYKLPRVAQCYLELKTGCAPWQCIRVRQPRSIAHLMLGKPWVTMSLVRWCQNYAPSPFTPEDNLLKAIYEKLVRMAGVPVDTFKFHIEENLEGKAELVVGIYTNVPHNGCSCGSGTNTAYPSVNGSCMRYHVDDFDGRSMMEGKHPCAAYASSDIGIAWLTNDANETVGRALLNPESKYHSRVYRYADDDCSAKATYAQAVEERLRSELKNLGYGHSSCALSGCHLNLNTQVLKSGEHWVLPYLDGNAVRCDSSTGIISTSGGDLLCQEHNPPIVPEMTEEDDMYQCTVCGDYYDESFVNEDSQGEYCCHNCQDNHFRCDDCGTWAPVDGAYSHCDYSYCESCWRRSYFSCDSCNESTSLDEQVCVAGGDHLCESCAEDYNRCHCCDELFHCDDTHADPANDGEYLCDSCYDDRYHECSECSNIIPIEDSLCADCTSAAEATPTPTMEATANA